MKCEQLISSPIYGSHVKKAECEGAHASVNLTNRTGTSRQFSSQVQLRAEESTRRAAKLASHGSLPFEERAQYPGGQRRESRALIGIAQTTHGFGSCWIAVNTPAKLAESDATMHGEYELGDQLAGL